MTIIIKNLFNRHEHEPIKENKRKLSIVRCQKERRVFINNENVKSNTSTKEERRQVRNPTAVKIVAT